MRGYDYGSSSGSYGARGTIQSMLEAGDKTAEIRMAIMNEFGLRKSQANDAIQTVRRSESHATTQPGTRRTTPGSTGWSIYD